MAARILLAVVVCLAPKSARAELLVVRQDGVRIVADSVAPETDALRLAVRRERAGIVLTRFVEWPDVFSVTVDGRAVDVDLWRPATRIVSQRVAEQPVASVGVLADLAPARATIAGNAASFGTAGTPPEACFEPMPFSPAVLLVPPLPTRGVIVAVTEDPLAAYADLVDGVFPAGVPVSEAGFALGLLRMVRAQQVLGGGIIVPPIVPSGVPSIVPAPGRLPADPEPNHVPPPPAVRSAPPALRSISVSAVPVSTRGNVDWDSLAIRVRGFDEFGSAAPVRGTLRLTLWGQSQQVVRPFGEFAVGAPDRLLRLATWTRAIGAGVPEAEFTAPLPDPFPDHDFSRAPYGQLQVELAAPGRGVFGAVDPLVPLAQIDPLRDRLLVETGSRFRPGEPTAGRPTRTGPRFFSPNAIRPDGRVLSVQP